MSVSVKPMAGQPLPDDWKSQAQKRAKAADAAYLDRLQNAWRGNPKENQEMLVKCARLEPDASWRELFGDK